MRPGRRPRLWLSKMMRRLSPLDLPAEQGVYFVRAGDFVKVGFASNISKRMFDLQVAQPHQLHLIAWMPGTMADERAMHARLRADRVGGEWFRISRRLILHAYWVRGGALPEHLPMIDLSSKILEGDAFEVEEVLRARDTLLAAAVAS